ncbi:hypothetical protein ACIQPP_41800 [Streptomyces violaceusniger]|uniref:hypothetical protein n=1 Tax=Streptomyces violaceusniger TaxID=68280 RepID=UPI00131DAE95|nr:hypothetical protein [Streptomyces hygroscopicus]
MSLAVLFERWTVTSKRCLAADASHQSGGRAGVSRGGGRVGAGWMPSANTALMPPHRELSELEFDLLRKRHRLVNAAHLWHEAVSDETTTSTAEQSGFREADGLLISAYTDFVWAAGEALRDPHSV